MKKKLNDLAHCRAGDKGNTSILSLIAYRDEDYAVLCAKVTAQKVKRHLAHIIKGKVTRHEVPNVGALQFVSDQLRFQIRQPLFAEAKYQLALWSTFWVAEDGSQHPKQLN